MTQRELPMLAGIAACLRWLEELAAILSGPLLTVGLGIALVDLLTDGRLLTSAPMLLYAWAISQSVGVDAQLVGSAAKLSTALRARRPWVVAGYLALVCVLAYVGYVASLVFATQEAQGITTAAALSRLGMDSTSWLWQRSGLAVLLVVLSGMLRYTPPAQASAEDERTALERELSLEPLRQQVRARKAIGAVGLGRQMLDAARGKEPPEQPPTGPGSPSLVPVKGEDAGASGDDPAPAEREVFPMEAPRQRPRRTAATVLRTKQRETVEALRETAAFALLDATPDMSVNALQDALHCRWETADKLRRKWIRKRHTATEAAQ